MAILLVVLYLLAIAPVQLSVTAAAAPGGQGGVARLTFWGVGARLFFILAREDDGTLTIRLRTKKGKREGRGDAVKAARKAIALVKTLRRERFSHAIISRALTCSRARGEVVIACGDAAATAIVTGAARTLLLQLGWRNLRLRPDFSGGSTRAEGECIIGARLGSILICAALAFAAWRKEKSKWRGIPSEV